MLTRERKVRARLGSDERQQHVAAARACVRFAFEIALALARVMMMIRSALFRSCKINRVTEVRNRFQKRRVRCDDRDPAEPVRSFRKEGRLEAVLGIGVRASRKREEPARKRAMARHDGGAGGFARSGSPLPLARRAFRWWKVVIRFL